MTTDRTLLAQALEGYELLARYMDGQVDDGPAIDAMIQELIAAIRARLAEPEPEPPQPVAWVATDAEMRHRDARWGRVMWINGCDEDECAGKPLYTTPVRVNEDDVVRSIMDAVDRLLIERWCEPSKDIERSRTELERIVRETLK